MIVVAIIAIISAIAVPAYQGYVQEARFSTARASIDTLQVFLEDYRLDNNRYQDRTGVASTTYSEAGLFNNYGWAPRDDADLFDFSLLATNDNYTVNVNYANSLLVSCTQNESTFSCNYSE